MKAVSRESRARSIKPGTVSLLFSYQPGSGDEAGRASLCFRLSEALCRQAKLLPGDRVDVQVDQENGVGRLVRTPGDGFALTASGKKVEELVEGGYYACSVKFTYRAGRMPSIDGAHECDKIECINDEVWFTFPGEAKF